MLRVTNALSGDLLRELHGEELRDLLESEEPVRTEIVVGDEKSFS